MAGPRVLLSCQRAPQIPLAANMRHRSEMAELQRVCHAMVRAAQQAGKRAPGTPSSLLDTLVSATDDGGVDGDPAQAASGTTGSKLSDRELIDQTLTFLVAGEMLPAARAAGMVSLSLSSGCPVIHLFARHLKRRPRNKHADPDVGHVPARQASGVATSAAQGSP